MKYFITSAMLGLLLVLPLMVMEFVNRQEFNEGYPFPIFILLWLFSASFIMILLSVIQDIRTGAGFFSNPLVLIKIILLILLVILWVWIVIDQMPCFLGVPHCD